jgi:hypothetical protein
VGLVPKRALKQARKAAKMNSEGRLVTLPKGTILLGLKLPVFKHNDSFVSYPTDRNVKVLLEKI